MIKLANEETKPLVRSMWKTVFQDADSYIDLIFEQKYRNENTLIYFEEGEAVASLQMTPYNLRFWGEIIPFYYLNGLCTLPQYRGKGYMRELILKSFEVMQDRKIPLSILIPAEDSLFNYYGKSGYIQTFDKGESHINMNFAKNYSSNQHQAFLKFNEELQQDDFTVLKTEDDFDVIMQEYLLWNEAPKYNQNGMSRIMDPLFLLNIYAEKNSEKEFAIRLHDPILGFDQIFDIRKGRVNLAEAGGGDFTVDTRLLTKLLFGYKLEEVASPIVNYFEEHNPIMNLMLE